MLHVFCTGILIANPERRAGSGGGEEYAVAVLAVDCGGGAPPLFVSFGARTPVAIEQLMRLRAGDECSVSGLAKLSEMASPLRGVAKVGMSLRGDVVLAAGERMPLKRKRQQRRGAVRRGFVPESAGHS